MDKEEYLNKRLKSQIDWYSNNSNLNKRYYFSLKTTEIILAGTVPFLIALSNNDDNLKVVAGILSVIVGIIASLLMAFKYQEKWIQYRSSCEKLKQEKVMFETQSGFYASNQDLKLFVERVEFIISKENSNWTQLIISNKKEDKKNQANI